MADCLLVTSIYGIDENERFTFDQLELHDGVKNHEFVLFVVARYLILA